MKRVFILIASLLIGVSAAAQSDFFGDMRYGVVGGLGYNSFQNIYGEQKPALAISAGAMAKTPIVVPELYLQGEAKFTLRTAGNYYTGQMSNVYLTIPVRVGYDFEINEDYSLFVEAGPYVGFRLFKTYHEIDHTGHINFIDLGAGLNFGVQFLNQFRVSVGGDLGFIRVCPWDHARNGSVWLGFTYLLN